MQNDWIRGPDERSGFRGNAGCYGRRRPQRDPVAHRRLQGRIDRRLGDRFDQASRRSVGGRGIGDDRNIEIEDNQPADREQSVTCDCAAGEMRMVRAERLVQPGWADRFHDAMKRKKAEGK